MFKFVEKNLLCFNRYILISLLALLLTSTLHAQSPDEPWTVPVNLSLSGTASTPLITAAPDGTLYVLWWDDFDGMYYARTVDTLGSAWTAPRVVPQIAGRRTVDEQSGHVTLVAPSDLRLLASTPNDVRAFWTNANGEFVSSRLFDDVWSEPLLLASSTLATAVAPNMHGGWDFVYVRAETVSAFPAGVYYRTDSAGGWSDSALVYASPYFRALKPDVAQVSVASSDEGHAIVAWRDAQLDTGLYAYSINGVQVWSEPQVIPSPSGPAQQARVAATADGTFLLLWTGAGTGGCGLSQQRSTDSGVTWSVPEHVLSELQRCPSTWQFAMGADKRLWLAGSPSADESGYGGAGVLAAWNGTAWSAPLDVGLSFRDPLTERSMSLGCLALAAGGPSVGLIGCDGRGDVWAVRSAVALDALLPVLIPTWPVFAPLADTANGAAGVPALTADTQGNVYALWSTGEPGTALYGAAFDGARWSRGASVLQVTEGKAEQPALAADTQGRVHAVWSGGAGGAIQYAWAYARDVASAQGWSAPVTLPAPSALGSWPDIVADPRGKVLHVVYAVPYNEGRGIYYLQSTDSGATWGAPVRVFDAVDAGWDRADLPRLALDAPASVLHVVWQRALLPGVPGKTALVYARSTDGGRTWSTPLTVAEGAINWPRLAAGKGHIHVLWNQTPTYGNDADELWGRFSPDGGMRWAEAERVPGFEAVNGPAGLVSDGAGGLYLAAVGTGPSGVGVLLTVRWNGAEWGERESMALAQDATSGDAAVLALGGGRLGLALRVQAGELVAGARAVEAVALTPAPTFTPLPTATPGSTSTPTPTATVRASVSSVAPPGEITTGVMQYVGVLGPTSVLTALVVAVVVGVWVMRGRRR